MMERVTYRGVTYEAETPSVPQQNMTAPHLEVVHGSRRRRIELPPEAAPAPKTLTEDRPRHIEEMVGQTALIDQLRIIVAGASIRGVQVPHLLFSGPAGHGKTTLAGIVANEAHGKLVTSSGMALQKSEDVVGLLAKMEPNTVLFIDEIHRLPIACMETLYGALEDRKVSTLIGTGKASQAHTFVLPPFTCVGATTKPGMLSAPMRDRFGFHGVVVAYTVEELAQIVGRAWSRAGVHFDQSEAREVGRRSKGVPRLALHLAERVLDYGAVTASVSVTEGLAATALSIFGIDARGLDQQDWKVLDALVNRFGGRSIGLDALSQFLDIDKTTLTEQIEPPLVHAGLIERAKSGRMALPAAFELFRKGNE